MGETARRFHTSNASVGSPNRSRTQAIDGGLDGLRGTPPPACGRGRRCRSASACASSTGQLASGLQATRARPRAARRQAPRAGRGTRARPAPAAPVSRPRAASSSRTARSRAARGAGSRAADPQRPSASDRHPVDVRRKRLAAVDARRATSPPFTCARRQPRRPAPAVPRAAEVASTPTARRHSSNTSSTSASQKSIRTGRRLGPLRVVPLEVPVDPRDRRPSAECRARPSRSRARTKARRCGPGARRSCGRDTPRSRGSTRRRRHRIRPPASALGSGSAPRSCAGRGA